MISDRTVADLHHATVARAIEDRGLASVLLLVPEGEDAKSLQAYESLLRQLAGREAHRDDAILALGGGAVGDLAGFVASTYMRGVPFIQVPTTLTAQVDAAIGGKTAVNLPEGKNLVGTFTQPVAVVADVEALATLDERDFRSGLAEVAKYALTLDEDLLAMLERDPGPGRAARRRRLGGRDRPVRRRQGPDRRRGRAGRERSARPQLRSHARPCARAAGFVPGPNPRRGRRPRDGVRGRAGGGAGARAGPARADRTAPRVARDRPGRPTASRRRGAALRASRQEVPGRGEMGAPRGRRPTRSSSTMCPIRRWQPPCTRWERPA